MHATDAPPEWERQFRTLLPLYGHRNWIVVADSAYPAQSKPGIATVVADDEQLHWRRRFMMIVLIADYTIRHSFIEYRRLLHECCRGIGDDCRHSPLLSSQIIVSRTIFETNCSKFANFRLKIQNII